MLIKIAIAEDNNFLAQAIQEKISFFEELKFKFRGANGAELIGKLAADSNAKHPQIKVIMLTVLDDDDNVFNAIKAGADGYLLKETNPEELYNGIKQVLDGGAAMTPSIALKTLNLLRFPQRLTQDKIQQEDIELSKREIEILEQLSKGLNYQSIADNLVISPATVRKHIENIYKKLQVHNKVEAVQKAIKHNLL
jgi:DNA-binding NarL/FixJ family response regulator